ncbi:MAG: hypothetical protein LBQ13_02440 [Endomicrobium sp.]|jgi:hypothetical protein|nr:hypothetical protein [Endomicrobium sp.]
MENNLKKIQDLRFYPSAYSDVIKQQIWSIAGNLGNNFLICIESHLPNNKWYMPNTEILYIDCANFKDIEYYLYTKIGDDKYGWMSEVRVHMDEEEFLRKKTETEKRLLIWSKIKEGILKFINLFPDYPFDKDIIEKVYETEMKNDFFLQVSKIYSSRDNKFEIHLEMQPESTGKKYYLALEEKGSYSKYFIADVEPSSMENISKWRYPKAKKWIGHKFYLDYNSSSVSSEIIFDADKKTIEIIDKIE